MHRGKTAAALKVESTIRRSRRLVAAAQSLCSAAAETHQKTSSIIHQAFARQIKGGSTGDSREEVIIRKLANGLLPWTKARKTVWGRGEGNSCEVCEVTIAPTQVQVAAHVDGSPAIRLHSRCFDTWQRACS
jgi:hypothetical protein